MGYGIDDGSKYYAFDGMHCNYNNIMTDAEEQSEKASVEQDKITLNKLKQKFLASLLTFESNLSIRNHLVKKILINDEKYMISRYSKKENLPQKYSLVAEQKEGLAILIKNFLKQIARIDLNEKIRAEIQHLINDTYENEGNNTAYNRVGLIRSYIYEAVKKKHGSDIGCDLPTNPTRCILSACRLHLNLFDIRKNNLDYLKSQIILNKSQYNIEMNTPLLSRYEGSNKKTTPHWKAQHMKTLLYFNNESSREVIDAILDFDVKLERDKYLDNILFAVLRNNYLDRLINLLKI